MQIQTKKIVPNPQQPRETFDLDGIASLAASISKLGLIQPIKVFRDNGHYVLVDDGESRLRAMRDVLGWETLEEGKHIIVVNELPDDDARLARALAANIHRNALNPIEEAKAYEYMRQGGESIAKIANTVGVSSARVSSRLRLLVLESEIQAMVARGELPVDLRMTKALMSVPEKHRVQIAQGLAKRNASLKVIVAACARFVENLDEPIKEGTPAMVLAQRRAGRQTNQSDWNILRQLGEAPPWALVERAAKRMCKNCCLGDIASPKVCQECPAIPMLQVMIEEGAP